MTFEEQMKRIEEIVISLEDGTMTLEESIARYKEGATLILDCKEKLHSAKNEIEEVRNTLFSEDEGNE